MKTLVSICFVARKNARQMKGKEKAADTPIVIECRIRVRGQQGKAEWCTGLATTYGNWEPANGMGRVKGKTAADRHINTQLTKLRDELNDIHADLERRGQLVRAQTIKRLYKSNGCVLTMQALFEAFLVERESLIGIDISAASVKLTKSRYATLKAFLADKKLVDLRPEEFTVNMADKFMMWSQKEQGHKRNYANKVLQVFNQALRWGVRRELLDKNPLEHYEYKSVAPGEIKYLTVGELNALATARLTSAALGRARDCFVFQCWTGLAYADLLALDVAKSVEYHRDATNTLRRVLRITRQKSIIGHGYECVIPLLPEAERILARYEDELPVVSNAGYNQRLKELGECCGIASDKMTTHVGRKTAGVMMLNLGMRMEVVSKFLGHSSVRMTEKVYAKILDTTLVDEFSRVFSGAVGVGVPTAVEPETQAWELPASQPQRALPSECRPATRVEKAPLVRREIAGSRVFEIIR